MFSGILFTVNSVFPATGYHVARYATQSLIIFRLETVGMKTEQSIY